MKTAAAPAPAPFDLGSLKTALETLMASDAFASLKQHLGAFRGAPATATANAAPGADAPSGAASALTSVTTYVKANPLKSAALGIGAAALLSRYRGKIGSATILSAVGIIGKQLLAHRR